MDRQGMDRRAFLQALPAVATVIAAGTGAAAARSPRPPVREVPRKPFELSVSQWSFHRAIFGDSREDYGRFIRDLHAEPDSVLRGPMDPRDVVVRARELGVGTVDLVNILFFAHATDGPWLADFRRRADAEAVGFGVLMVDEEGHIGASSPSERREAVERHRRWVDCAAALGCRSVRVNAYGDGTYLDQLHQCAESLVTLGDLGDEAGLDILVENHGHPSSNGAWLAMLMQATDHRRVGVLADLDNFFMGGWDHDPQRRYDAVQGMEDLAPYTRAISAKSYEFGPDGRETRVDFRRLIQIAVDAGFRGLASAEYEGERLSEADGTEATVALLRTVRDQILASGG